MLKKHIKIIEQINKEAMDKYGDDLFVEKKKNPELEEMIENVIAGKHKDLIDEDKKKQLEAMYNKGYFSHKEKLTDPLVEKKFDLYVRRRQIQEIKAGRLPNPKDDPDFQAYKNKQK